MIHEKANEKKIKLTPSFQNNLPRKIISTICRKDRKMCTGVTFKLKLKRPCRKMLQFKIRIRLHKTIKNK